MVAVKKAQKRLLGVFSWYLLYHRSNGGLGTQRAVGYRRYNDRGPSPGSLMAFRPLVKHDEGVTPLAGGCDRTPLMIAPPNSIGGKRCGT